MLSKKVIVKKVLETFITCQELESTSENILFDLYKIAEKKAPELDFIYRKHLKALAINKTN